MFESVIIIIKKECRLKLKRNIDADVSQKPGELVTVWADKLFCNDRAGFFFFF